MHGLNIKATTHSTPHVHTTRNYYYDKHILSHSHNPSCRINKPQRSRTKSLCAHSTQIRYFVCFGVPSQTIYPYVYKKKTKYYRTLDVLATHNKQLVAILAANMRLFRQI